MGGTVFHYINSLPHASQMLISFSGCALPHVALQHQTDSEKQQACWLPDPLLLVATESSNEASPPKSKLTQGFICFYLLVLSLSIKITFRPK